MESIGQSADLVVLQAESLGRPKLRHPSYRYRISYLPGILWGLD